jgi:hypothetical protein
LAPAIATPTGVNETFLTCERRGCAFANHPIIFATVIFSPRKIVMVVNFFQDRRAKNLGNFLADPISSGVCIFSAEMHALDVLIAQVAVHVDYARIDIHAVFSASFL